MKWLKPSVILEGEEALTGTGQKAWIHVFDDAAVRAVALPVSSAAHREISMVG